MWCLVTKARLSLAPDEDNVSQLLTHISSDHWSLVQWVTDSGASQSSSEHTKSHWALDATCNEKVGHVFKVCLGSLSKSAIARLACAFVFPGKAMQGRRKPGEVRKCVCADRARSCLINPRKPCYQEAGITATGSERGLSSVLLRLHNNDQITHTMTTRLTVFSVCLQGPAHGRSHFEL